MSRDLLNMVCTFILCYFRVLELENLDNILDTFSNYPEMLFEIGENAYNIGMRDIRRIPYLKIAIKVFKEALKIRTIERFPVDYAMTQNNLGAA